MAISCRCGVAAAGVTPTGCTSPRDLTLGVAGTSAAVQATSPASSSGPCSLEDSSSSWHSPSRISLALSSCPGRTIHRILKHYATHVLVCHLAGDLFVTCNAALSYATHTLATKLLSGALVPTTSICS